MANGRDNRTRRLELLDVRSLGALAALGNLERYLLAFIKGLEAVALDCAEVHEYVVAFVCGDESVTLSCVKPFYCAVAFQCVASQQEKL